MGAMRDANPMGQGLLVVATLLCACQSSESDMKAVLESADAASLADVRATLARAMGKASVELGPENLTRGSSISVLPPPLSSREDRSTATPTVFDLVLRDGACCLVRRETGEAFALKEARCVAAAE
jgi:hypothetical protein